MTAIEDLLAKVKPATASVRVCLRGDLLGELDLINFDLEPLQNWEPSSLSDPDPRTELLEQKDNLEKLMRTDSATFTFTNIGDKPWSDLMAAHPSPKDDKGNDKFDYDPQTFPVSLVAAASVDPKMTQTQAEKLFDNFTLTQRNIVFSCAYRANVRGVDIPFSQPAFDVTAASAKK